MLPPAATQINYEGLLDHACRFDPNNPQDKGVDGVEYDKFNSVNTLYDCQQICTAESTCTGVEYRSDI